MRSTSARSVPAFEDLQVLSTQIGDLGCHLELIFRDW